MATNQYVRFLGWAAIALFVLGMVVTVAARSNGPYSVTSPMVYLGIALGIIWLVVKAVIAGKDTGKREKGSETE